MARDHAQHRSTLTGELAAGISHDFNNILATLLGSLELMERRLDRLPQEEQDRFSRLIQRSTQAVQTAASMNSRLLAFALRKAQPVEQIELAALIPELLALARGALGRRIQASTLIPPDLAAIPAERAQLELALLALILAIRDEMPEGGQLTISAADGPTHVELTISHAGSPPDQIAAELAGLLSDLNAALNLQPDRAMLRLPKA